MLRFTSKIKMISRAVGLNFFKQRCSNGLKVIGCLIDSLVMSVSSSFLSANITC